MTRHLVSIQADTLRKLVDAARKWSTELDDYVIPSAQETSDEDAVSSRAQEAEIDRAIEIAEQALAAPVVRPQTVQPAGAAARSTR